MLGESLVDDTGAWSGKARSYTQPGDGSEAIKEVVSYETNKLRYYAYSIGFRIKCNNTSFASPVFILRVYKWDGANWIEVGSQSINGTDVLDVNNFYVYPLNFNHLSSIDNKLKFVVESQAIANLKIDIDSIVCQPAHTSVIG